MLRNLKTNSPSSVTPPAGPAPAPEPKPKSEVLAGPSTEQVSEIHRGVQDLAKSPRVSGVETDSSARLDSTKDVARKFTPPMRRPGTNQRFRNDVAGDFAYTLVRRIAWSGNHIFNTAISPDGQFYLGGGDTGTLRIWDVAGGNLKLELPTPLGIFTPDGNQVIGHNSKKAITVFCLTDGKAIRTWETSHRFSTWHSPRTVSSLPVAMLIM